MYVEESKFSYVLPSISMLLLAFPHVYGYRILTGTTQLCRNRYIVMDTFILHEYRKTLGLKE